MKEMWKNFRKGAIAVSCGMAALGILMVLWPGISALTVCIILGIFCMASGIYAMVRYFKLGMAGLFFRSDLSFGICSILLGVLLLLHPYGAMVFLPIAAGFFMIAGSVLAIQISIEMRRLHLGNWVLTLILGIINTVFAFLLLINPFEGASVLMIFVGISLIIDSIQNFYSIYCISKSIKASKNNQFIDVEWHSLD